MGRLTGLREWGAGDGHAHREMRVAGSAEEGGDRAVTKMSALYRESLCGGGSPVSGLEFRVCQPHPVAGSD